MKLSSSRRLGLWTLGDTKLENLCNAGTKRPEGSERKRVVLQLVYPVKSDKKPATDYNTDTDETKDHEYEGSETGMRCC